MSKYPKSDLISSSLRPSPCPQSSSITYRWPSGARRISTVNHLKRRGGAPTASAANDLISANRVASSEAITRQIGRPTVSWRYCMYQVYTARKKLGESSTIFAYETVCGKTQVYKGCRFPSSLGMNIPAFAMRLFFSLPNIKKRTGTRASGRVPKRTIP